MRPTTCAAPRVCSCVGMAVAVGTTGKATRHGLCPHLAYLLPWLAVSRHLGSLATWCSRIPQITIEPQQGRSRDTQQITNGHRATASADDGQIQPASCAEYMYHNVIDEVLLR